MARYPGAVWKPITASKGRQRLTVWNRVNLHSTASSAASQFGYFNQSGIPDSHFHVAYDGTVEQYVDTAWRAFADLEGNDATISIETAGVARDGNEPWTPAQVKAIIKLVAWIMKTHNIPVRLATDSKTGASSRGLSWHRLGVDGNFPQLPSIQAGRVQRGGGMHYSSSKGKICPGYKRIDQIHAAVFPGVKALMSPTVSKPTNTTQQEDTVALTTTDKEFIRDAISEALEHALHEVEIDVPSNLVPYLGATATRDSIIRTAATRAEMARVAASQ